MKKKLFYLFFLALSTLMLFPVFSSAADADKCGNSKKLIKEAEESVEFEAKLKKYETALDECPDSLEVLSLLTDLYLDYELYDEAYGVVYRILSINKYQAEGYYKLAFVKMMWGEYDDAEEAVKESLKINNYNVEAYLVWGDIKYYTRDYKESMKFYKRALEIDSKNTDAFMKIANVFFLFEKYDKVVTYLDKVLAVNENEEISLLKRLMQKKIENDYNGIKSVAGDVLKINPKNLMALETLSIAMIENEKEKTNCLDVLTKIYYLERQPFMKGKIEKEIDRIVTAVAARR